MWWMIFLLLSIRRDLPQTPNSKWTNLSVLRTHTLCCFPVTMHERPGLPFKTPPPPGAGTTCCPCSLHTKIVLQLPLSSALSSLSSLENSHQGTCCNTKTKQSRPFSRPFILLQQLPYFSVPLYSKTPLDWIINICSLQFLSSLLPISIMLLSSTLQLNAMSGSLKSIKLLGGDSQMKYCLTH